MSVTVEFCERCQRDTEHSGPNRRERFCLACYPELAPSALARVAAMTHPHGRAVYNPPPPQEPKR
jgi:hypothetical protein